MKWGHIHRVCVGEIENVWPKERRVFARVINSVQYPAFNAILWGTGASLDYDQIIQYTQTKWNQIIAVVARLRENQTLLNTLLQPHYEAKEEKPGAASLDCQDIMMKTIQVVLESSKGLGDSRFVDTTFVQAFDKLRCNGFLYFFFSKEDGVDATTVTGGGLIPDRAVKMTEKHYPKQFKKLKTALNR